MKYSESCLTFNPAVSLTAARSIVIVGGIWSAASAQAELGAPHRRRRNLKRRIGVGGIWSAASAL
mgnify:FL=1